MEPLAALLFIEKKAEVCSSGIQLGLMRGKKKKIQATTPSISSLEQIVMLQSSVLGALVPHTLGTFS